MAGRQRGRGKLQIVDGCAVRVAVAAERHLAATIGWGGRGEGPADLGAGKARHGLRGDGIRGIGRRRQCVVAQRSLQLRQAGQPLLRIQPLARQRVGSGYRAQGGAQQRGGASVGGEHPIGACGSGYRVDGGRLRRCGRRGLDRLRGDLIQRHDAATNLEASLRLQVLRRPQRLILRRRRQPTGGIRRGRGRRGRAHRRGGDQQQARLARSSAERGPRRTGYAIRAQRRLRERKRRRGEHRLTPCRLCQTGRGAGGGRGKRRGRGDVGTEQQPGAGATVGRSCRGGAGEGIARGTAQGGRRQVALSGGQRAAGLEQVAGQQRTHLTIGRRQLRQVRGARGDQRIQLQAQLIRSRRRHARRRASPFAPRGTSGTRRTRRRDGHAAAGVPNNLVASYRQ